MSVFHLKIFDSLHQYGKQLNHAVIANVPVTIVRIPRIHELVASFEPAMKEVNTFLVFRRKDLCEAKQNVECSKKTLKILCYALPPP